MKPESPTRTLSIPLRRIASGARVLEHLSLGEDRGTSDATKTRTAIAFEPDISPTRHAELVGLLTTERPDGIERTLRGRAADLSSEDLHAHAVLLVFADLLAQGWGFSVHRGVIWATPPLDTPNAGERVEEVKARLRDALMAGRDRQLNEPSVRAFIRRMERTRRVNGERVSVLSLIDDGHDLADALRAVSSLPPSEREAALARVVDPRVEVAGTGTICHHTGLPLLDIWRYFRHTWSLEYRPTPGRSLYLLIRNAARPRSPIMAIAALANAVPQLRDRDRWIGWTVRSYIEQAHQEPDRWPERLDALIRTVREARAAIRSDDLFEDVGGHSAHDLERRLRDLAYEATQEREAQLAARENERRAANERGARPASLRRLPTDADGNIDWFAASGTPLFRRKRADTLADLLLAERCLQAAPRDAGGFLRAVAVDTELRRAMAIALREVRKVGLASRLLDLNVCGAVEPYRDLLAGKLAALAVASAEVSARYQDRYGAHVSEIASQMAGRPIVREPIICAITTTSLYGVASSQYNRLRVSIDSDGQKPMRLNWQELGITEGFGTVHLSEATVQALRRVSIAHHGHRHVNNVFGEGTSPRLRQVRDAFTVLRLGSQEALKHHTSRRVYGLELFAGGLTALATNTPSTTERTLPSFRDIASAWRTRWLLRRIQNTEVIRRVATVTVDDVRAELRPRNSPQVSLSPERVSPVALAQSSSPRVPMTAVRPRPELVQSLYRSLSTCADHHDASTVELLHIKTSVDSFVLQEVQSGRIVFVTGNPGDGKTHLLRRLTPQLEQCGASIVLDANEQADEDLVAIVESALSEKEHGCAIAINQGILMDLLRLAGDRPWARSARQQLLHPFEYRTARGDTSAIPSAVDNEDAGSIRIVDLNLRNNLGADVITKALALLVELSQGCTVCPPGKCPGEVNGERLRDPRVVDRLVGLLDRIAQTGFHATMRDVQGFLSFLIWGGRECANATESMTPVTPYWQNAFVGGVGDLFTAVRNLDPKDHPAPLLDDVLWRRADRPEDWFIPYDDDPRTTTGLLEHRDQFVIRKRRAMFEHRRAEMLLKVTGSTIDQQFAAIVESARSPASRLVRLLNRFFDRDDDRDDDLRLWVTHRYDARASRYAAAAVSVSTIELEVVTPALPATLRPAFPDYRPDHAILKRREDPVNQGLRIDRLLLESLLAAEQGLPSTFRRGEPEARIATFFNRLARDAWETAEGSERLKVRMVDIDTGRHLDLSVDIEQRRYQRY